jgi:hypothetical protein
MIFNPGVQIDVYQVKSLSKRIILFIYIMSLYPGVQKRKLPICNQGDLHNLSHHIPWHLRIRRTMRLRDCSRTLPPKGHSGLRFSAWPSRIMDIWYDENGLYIWQHYYWRSSISSPRSASSVRRQSEQQESVLFNALVGQVGEADLFINFGMTRYWGWTWWKVHR